MRRGHWTVLVLGFVLLLGGRFATVRAEGFSPTVRHNTAAGSLARSPKRLHNAGDAPGLLFEEAVDRCFERDDDETRPPLGGYTLWTDPFLFRRIDTPPTALTSRSRRDESRIAHGSAPLRC